MAVSCIVRVSELEGTRRLDPEYYTPDLQALSDRLAPRSVALGGICEWITQGPNPRFLEEGKPCLNGRNVAAGWVDEDTPNFVGGEEFSDLGRYVVKPGDILVTLKGLGSIGQSGLVCDQPEAIFSRDLGLVRLRASSGFLPEYVFAYLSCKSGRKLMDRGTSGGTGQMTLAVSYLANLPVPRTDPAIQESIRELVQRSGSERRASKSLYREAERLVLEELGWNALDLSQPRWWTAPLCRARGVQRLDADHFQPKYDKLIAHLEGTGRASPLGQIATYIKRGVQPRYVEDGEVLAINSRYVGRQLINSEQAERTDMVFWNDNPRARACKRDVIINSTGWGTIGRANCVLHDEKTVVDNHVTVIRAKEDACDPVYLAVYLNSQAGLMQTGKWLRGSSGQIELYPGDIARFVVYVPSEKAQDRVAELVTQSYHARERAKALLDEAKREVEALIESAVGGQG